MGKKTEFVFLSEEDMVKAGVLDAQKCVDCLDEMFNLVGQGDYIMGGLSHNEHGIRIAFPDNPQFEGMPANGPDRRFMAMPAYLGGRFHIAGEKWYGSNIANPSRGLPRSVLMVMLNDVDTGEPVALCSGNLASAMRTGGVPGVAVRYLARKDASTMGIIGAGPIQRACVQGMMVDAKNVKTIYCFDVKPEAAEKFGAWAKEEYGVDFVICNTMEEALAPSDIVSFATSRLRPVHVPESAIKKGATLIFTGAAKIEEGLLAKSKIFFDNAKLHAASIDECKADPAGLEASLDYNMTGSVYRMILNGKLPDVLELPDLGGCACGKYPGRTNDDDIIFCMTGGMAVEDLAWCHDLVENAKAQGIGTTLKLWDSPMWM